MNSSCYRPLFCGRFRLSKHTSCRLPILCASSSSSSSPGPTNSRRGPHKTYDLNPITFTVGRNSDGEPVTAKVCVTVPMNGRKSPLALIAAGFLLDGSLYTSYSGLMASHGITAATFDLSELVDDEMSARAMRSLIEQCGKDMQLGSFVDPSRLILIGHSRGAKLSILAASKGGVNELDGSVKALVLLDPVNNSPATPTGPGYPNSLPYLKQYSPLVPTLIIGASKGDDVVPAEANYSQFYRACSSPTSSLITWLIELPCGHLQFLDRQVAFFSLFSAPGLIDDALVRSISQSAMITFLETIGLISSDSKGEQPSSVRLKLEEEAKAIKRIAPGSNSFLHGSLAQTSSSASSSSGSSKKTSQPQEAATSSSQRYSYNELMALRASEIKRILGEQGISCTDCFDKESLARRLLERKTR